MECITSWAQWKQWAKEEQWTCLPYAVKWKSPKGLPADWMSAWERSQAYSFVLESGKGGGIPFSDWIQSRLFGVRATLQKLNMWPLG